MAPKLSLNAQNLEALGAKRLAELLIEISDGNAAVKRRLRLALAGAQSPAEASREIRKRLSAIWRSRTFVDWQNRRALVEDLETQRRAIVDHVAKTDPKEALELMRSFMGLVPSVFARCDDSSGTVMGIFHEGVSDLGRLAEAAKGDKKNWPIAHTRRCSTIIMGSLTVSSPRSARRLATSVSNI